MARYGVTYEKVASIAADLVANDINPTVDRVRTRLGSGTKSTIAKHLKRWRVQTELGDAPPMKSFDPNHMPEELMVLMQDFWQSFYRAQMSEPDAETNSASPPSGFRAAKTTPLPHSATSAVQNMNEHIELIQDYVVGLEVELAESTALQHRLAQRLGAFYAQPLTRTVTSDHEINTSARDHVREGTDTAAMSPEDLADPQIHPMPILAELSAVQAALSRAEQTHSRLTEDLDWATRSAFDLASTEAELKQQLKRARQQIDAGAVREAALAAENHALKDQITHLRRALAQRQRFIERLEGEVLSFKPADWHP